jgi:hypothetical protein
MGIRSLNIEAVKALQRYIKLHKKVYYEKLMLSEAIKLLAEIVSRKLTERN